jgi:hypothetical protein
VARWTILDAREAVTMLGLTKYRLRERLPAANVYEFLDPESGALVGAADPGAVKTAERGPSGVMLSLLSSWVARY